MGMAVLNLEDVATLKLEVDTAASHNIISQECYDALQANLLKCGKEKSKSLARGVKIKLADGSIAPQECKVIQVNVSKSLNEFNEVYPLTFLVVSGPNNLIGRYSLERLWPEQFKALVTITSQNVKDTQTPVFDLTINKVKSNKSRSKSKKKPNLSKIISKNESGRQSSVMCGSPARAQGPNLSPSSSQSRTQPMRERAEPVRTRKTDDVAVWQ